jgi:hypothetical protein
VIAKRLYELQANQRLRTGMGDAALAASRRYGWAPVVEAYARLYGEFDGHPGNDR